MANYKKSAAIVAEKDGTFTFDNRREFVICNDKHDVGLYLEQMLWPLIEPLLDAGEHVKIIVKNIEKC